MTRAEITTAAVGALIGVHVGVKYAWGWTWANTALTLPAVALLAVCKAAIIVDNARAAADQARRTR